MLETRKERVKLLKAGFSGKMIERLYIESNSLKIICFPPFIKLMEIEIPPDCNNRAGHKAIAKCA